MSELSDLYQEMILDHHRSPKNYRVIEGGRQAKGFNPLCGDLVTVYVQLEGDVLKDVSFQGQGCAISRASASLMTAAVKGLTLGKADALFRKFQRAVTGEPVDADQQAGPAGDGVELGKLEALSGVSQFPVRVKCATLAWHALRAAIEAKEGTVTTEDAK